MSARTIARWNAIPASRPETNEPMDSTMKQLHPDDSDDDDISLVSRTPSPPPEPMNVDENLSKYDEYIRGNSREVITVETKIKNTNKGFAMLAKLGWTEGQPLGLSGDGRVDPVPFQIKRDLTGLGKINQDVRMIETTVSQRRELDSERQQKETEEQRRLREDAVTRRANLQSEISSTLKAFYCTLCDKQFRNVAQYDEHTNSYAHHHKARFKDMQASQRIVPKEEVEKRKEKERKREEKELRKIAKAAGIKMVAKPAMAVPPPFAPAPPTDPAPVEDVPKPSGFKKSGWATVANVVEPTRTSQTPSRSGWKTMEPASAVNIPAPASPPPQPGPPPPPNPRDSFNAPSFRTAGWTSLDTSSSSLPPPPSSTSPPPPPPPQAIVHPPPPPPAATFTSHGWNAPTIPPEPPTFPTSSGQLPGLPPIPPSLSSAHPLLSSDPHRAASPSTTKPARVENNRSGWQQWKRGSGSGKKKS
ncbi:hypothetical protein SERLA73DRAFT_163206 [Serpula lacrymans var. lacrymans S7.3]|uniref:G-patch domain-containing protein n=1 Tax=Serpula lacrymans var. lacrymans (strain S7.3) TaxID=936435 RepID=F8QC74_SERL3|nr:hypothetical protein SERLA73DRAFT_163206 [Serpula lacrymans var. lacrymans S7.3]